MLPQARERSRPVSAGFFEQLLRLSFVLVEIDAYGQCHDGSFPGVKMRLACCPLTFRQKRVSILNKRLTGWAQPFPRTRTRSRALQIILACQARLIQRQKAKTE